MSQAKSNGNLTAERPSVDRGESVKGNLTPEGSSVDPGESVTAVKEFSVSPEPYTAAQDGLSTPSVGQRHPNIEETVYDESDKDVLLKLTPFRKALVLHAVVTPGTEPESLETTTNQNVVTAVQVYQPPVKERNVEDTARRNLNNDLLAVESPAVSRTEPTALSNASLIISASLKRPLGKNKYGIKGMFAWRDPSIAKHTARKSLLVWDASELKLNHSDEFNNLLNKRKDLKCTPAFVNPLEAPQDCKEDVITLTNGTTCRFLLPSACEAVFTSDKVIPVFQPSYRRSQVMKNPKTVTRFESFKENDRFLRIVVVGNSDAEVYASILMKERCAMLILPLDHQGLGYARNIIQHVSYVKRWWWVWMIDDSASSFYEMNIKEVEKKKQDIDKDENDDDDDDKDYYEKEGEDKEENDNNNAKEGVEVLKLKLSVKDVLIRMWNKFKESHRNDNRNKIATIGSAKFRGGRGTTIDYKERYASSVILLNVKATCEAEVFYNPLHTFAEDICFCVLCLAAGLHSLVDTIHPHSKSQLNGGASNKQTAADKKQNALVEQRKAQESDASALIPGSISSDKMSIVLPVALQSCKQITVVPFVENIFLIQGSGNDKLFGCVKNTSDRVDTFPFDNLHGIYRGFERKSIFAIDLGGDRLTNMFANGDADSVLERTDNFKMRFAAARTDNTYWIASEFKKEKIKSIQLKDERKKEFVRTYNAKSGTMYASLVHLASDLLVAARSNGDLQVFYSGNDIN
jgi:hypothetical protein